MFDFIFGPTKKEKEQIKQKIQNVIRQQKFNSIFFDIVESTATKFFAITKYNGLVILVYNPKNVPRLIEANALEASLWHEFLHAILLHYERIEEIQKHYPNDADFWKIANFAADSMVNDLIPKQFKEQIIDEEIKNAFFDYSEEKDGTFIFFAYKNETLEEYIHRLMFRFSSSKTKRTIAKPNIFSDDNEGLAHESFSGKILRPSGEGKKFSDPNVFKELDKKYRTIFSNQTNKEQDEQKNKIDTFSILPHEIFVALGDEAVNKIRKELAGKTFDNIRKFPLNYINAHFAGLDARRIKTKTPHRPNRRGLPLQGTKYKKEPKEIVVLLDVSYSILGGLRESKERENTLNFLKEVVRINQYYGCVVLKFTTFVEEEKYYPIAKMNTRDLLIETKDYRTDISSPLRYAKEKYGDNKVYIIITDLYVDSIDKDLIDKNVIFLVKDDSRSSNYPKIAERHGIPHEQIFIYK